MFVIMNFFISIFFFFFLNDTPPTEISTLPLPAPLPISLLADRLSTPLVLGSAAPHLLGQARRQEELVVGIRKHDGADVAAGHDDAVLAHLPLLRDQSLAHARRGRDHRQGVREVGVVDALRELLAVRPHPLALDSDQRAVRESGRCFRIMWVDPLLGAKPRDGAIHQSAVDEGKPKRVRDAPSHRRLARSDAAVDGDDHGRPDALRRAATSASRSTRQFPSLRRPRRSGPKAVRFSACTRCPTASSMRRTWRWRPSRLTTRSSAAGPGSTRITSTSAGAVTPSSSSTPERSRARSLRLGVPPTIATYSLSTLYRGCVRRYASSPSSVISNSPVESTSRRPTGKTRWPDAPSPSTSRTLVRPASSFAVVMTPTGLLSIT